MKGPYQYQAPRGKALYKNPQAPARGRRVILPHRRSNNVTNLKFTYVHIDDRKYCVWANGSVDVCYRRKRTGRTTFLRLKNGRTAQKVCARAAYHGFQFD